MSFNNYLSTRINGDFEIYDLSLNIFPYKTISSNVYDASGVFLRASYMTISSLVPLFRPYRFYINGVNNTYNISNLSYLYNSISTLSGSINAQNAYNILTYQPISSMFNYLTSASASSLYQTIANTNSQNTYNYLYLTSLSGSINTQTSYNALTYQPIANMTNYLTSANAATTYLTSSSASSLYQTIANTNSQNTYNYLYLTSLSGTLNASALTNKTYNGLNITSTTGTLNIASNYTLGLTGNSINFANTAGGPSTITVQQTGGVLLFRDNTQAITSKTYNGLTIPTTTGTLNMNTQTLTLSGITTYVTSFIPTGTSNLTLPSGNDTLVGQSSLSSYQTVANMSNYATLNNPTFTGVPSAPTATAGTNTTQLATTAFVLANSSGSGTNILPLNNTWTGVQIISNNSAGSGTTAVTQYNLISQFNATTPTSGVEIGSGIRLTSVATGGVNYYGGEIVGSVKSGTNHYLKFNTHNNGTVNERIRITGNEGYVGINTASPAYILDVNGTLRVNSSNTLNNKLLVLWDGGSSDSLATANNFFGFGINSSTLRYQVPSGSLHAFYNGTSEYMRIANGGKVGINTTTPAYILDVNGTLRVNSSGSVNNKLLVLYDSNSGESLTTGTSFYGFGINGSTLRYQVPSGNLHAFYNGTSEFMRIDGIGNLGVGTNNPLATLHVNATVAGAILRISGINATGYMFVNSTGSLGFYNNTSNTWSISYGGDINANSLTTSSLYLNTTNPSNTGQLGYIFSTSTTTLWGTTTKVVAQLSMGYSGTYIINFVFNCQCSTSSFITVNFYNNPSSSTSLYTYATNFIATSSQQYGCCSFPFSESYIEARIGTSGNNASCNAKLQATRVG
jgi:hypothetical protein